jgi:AcrR family transcriptional regulator
VSAGSGTRLSAEQRRRQIIDEAVRVVGRRGYYGFSVQEVAERCGLTVAGVLHHVGTKHGLLIAVLEDRDRRDHEAVTGGASFEALPAPPEQMSIAEVGALLRRHVVRNAAQPELVRLYSMLRAESLYAGHPAYAYFRDRDESTLAKFTRLLTGKVDEPRSGARQLLALMGGLEEQWLRDPEGMDLVAEWDRAAVRVLRPD